MISYEQAKVWVKENKQQIVLAVCFVLVFIVGFGSGRYEREFRRQKIKPQNNYTTNASKTPVAPPLAKQGTEATFLGAKTASSTADCLIKGNIAATGKKLFHVPTGAFYITVKPEQCFKTESEAVAAGFIKSSR